MRSGGIGLEQRRNLTGWIFLIPAALLILVMNFYPMFRAFLLSMQTGRGSNMDWADPIWYNYARLLDDNIFRMTVTNTFIYLILQVPLMLVTALVLANLLNDKNLKFKGLWRTAIFLPCAVSLVSYSLVFRTMFATNGMANGFLMSLNVIDSPINWLGRSMSSCVESCGLLLWLLFGQVDPDCCRGGRCSRARVESLGVLVEVVLQGVIAARPRLFPGAVVDLIG